MRRPSASAAAIALAVLVVSGEPSRAAAPTGTAPVDSASVAHRAGPADAAIRFESLLPRLETALAAARADTALDPAAWIEAEETAAVAEELLTEGEAEIALDLLERAIALLPPEPE